MHISFKINAKQVRDVYEYRNIKQKLHKTI
jgi:hypothetical protein